MNWKLTQLGADPVIAFAVDELRRYLKKADRSARIAVIRLNALEKEAPDALYVGTSPAYDALLPETADPARDDAICIRVTEGAGVITGTNPRSVLIAVYRFLRELGFAFVRPGEDGERIPDGIPEDFAVRVCEAAAYRHRAVCIEGALSYEHVANMIDWLPKIAMNGYFFQFQHPYEFLRRWYNHEFNPVLPPEPMSDAELDGIYDALRGEIAKRGLMYHAVGHSWTCEPFGVNGSGWSRKETDPPDAVRPMLAMVNGKRDWWHHTALDTNLCYSNPAVRGTVISAIADYCAAHPDVDYLHFWLADGSNNHCECENCREQPSDYYVMMLNELDALLSERGIPTKIVFLIYVDLLWAPGREILKNPDRFVLMFAPITRTYSASFTVPEEEVAAVELSPYVKNRLKMPESVAENVARLRSWQANFPGDSFDFDYHLMWDHYNDPGHVSCAKLLWEDMRNLAKIGLGGMNSCQTNRACFPTALPMVAMAEALWNRDTEFDDIAARYFYAAFGKDGVKVRRYLTDLSALFDPVYLRGEKPLIDADRAKVFASIPARIDEFLPVIREHKDDADPAVRQSWVYLSYHAAVCRLFAEACAFRAADKKAEAHDKFEALADYLHTSESVLHPVFDVWNFLNRMEHRFRA